MNHLCPHKQNPRACLKCFNAPKAKAAPAARPIPGNPNGVPVKELPGRHAAIHQGSREGAMIGQAVTGQPEITPEERERYRYPKGRPGQVSAGPQRAPREAFSSARQDGSEFSNERLWEPPTRPELMDRLPTHPQAGKR